MKYTENDFYQRQTSLSEVGEAGQKRLKDSKVLVIGAGGLGCPVLEYIVAAGVGDITICDFDTVDYTNLHRQVLFNPTHIGKYKAEVAAARLREQNPYITITTVLSRFDLEFDITSYDLVIDCSDNFKTKFMAHDLCYQNNLTLIQGSIHKFEGQIQVFDYADPEVKTNKPCLRCLWPKTPEKSCVQTCSEAGVLGVVPGVIGSMQASEAIKRLLKLPTLNTGETLIINLFNFSTQKIKWQKSHNCPLCSVETTTLNNFNYGDTGFEITKDEVNNDYIFLNLASTDPSYFENSIEISLDSLVDQTNHIDLNKNILIYCNQGITSLKATKLLRARGFTNCYSLKDGIQKI